MKVCYERENVFFTLKIPDFLFTVIQLLLVSRFVARVFKLLANSTFMQWLYDSTNFLTFPLGVVLRRYFVEGSLVYETFLIGAGIIYVVLYLVILDFLKILFNEKDDDDL